MAKILVIDDEAQLRDLLTKMLERDGHKVATAFDGEEGIRVFGQFNPDLVITDIIMPNKDGVEVIMDLVAVAPNIPIIAISGGRRTITAEFNLESAEMLGVSGILPKPFTRDQLLETVNRVLG